MEQQCPRTSNNLRKEIVVTLIVKALFLYLLWFLFFQEPENQPPPNEQIERSLFGISSTPSLHPNSQVLQPKETLHGN
ncbi:cytochrome oxidase putative small subunit CydP [Kaarinaea lacus]